MELVFRQAVEWCRKGDYQKGIELFDKVIETQPAHEASLYNRAKAKAKLDLLVDALLDFNQLINLFPSNGSYLSDRGVLYHHLDQPERAIQDLDKACILEPEKAYRYASRAYLKDQMGDLKGSLEDYKIAIKLDPEDAVSLNNSGLVLEKMGHMEQSKKSFEKADKIYGVDNLSYPAPPTKENDLYETSKTDLRKSNTPLVKKSLTISSYGSTLKSLFTSNKVRREFLRFIIDTFSFNSK